MAVGRRGRFAAAARAPPPAALATTIPADPGADPAVERQILVALASGRLPEAVSSDEARVLYAQKGWVLLDVRSALEVRVFAEAKRGAGGQRFGGCTKPRAQTRRLVRV